MHRDDLDPLKDELKAAITRKFERETGGTAELDEQIVDDEEMKLSLFEDPEIHDLLEALVGEQEEKLQKLHRGQVEFDDLLFRELEEVLREMTMEAESSPILR